MGSMGEEKGVFDMRCLIHAIDHSADDTLYTSAITIPDSYDSTENAILETDHAAASTPSKANYTAASAIRVSEYPAANSSSTISGFGHTVVNADLPSTVSRVTRRQLSGDSNAASGPPLKRARRSSSNSDQQVVLGGQTNVIIGNSHFTGARDISIQSATFIGSVGGNVFTGNITNNITNNSCSTSEPQEQAQVPECDVKDVRDWLKAPTATFDDILTKTQEQRMEGTCEWFTKSTEFQEFVVKKGAILWGTGLPGAGKTFISGASTMELRKIFKGQFDIAVIHVFLRYSDTLNPRDVYASILDQVIRGHCRALPQLVPSLAHCKEVGGELSPKATEKDILKHLQAAVEELKDFFVVIDGLDEAPDGTKDSLIQVLPSMGANILIMSRPLDLYTLQSPNALLVPIQARTQDIDLFVRDRAWRCSKLRLILKNDPELIKQLSDCIIEKSKGMFLSAFLQVEIATQNAITLTGLFKALDKIPAGVNELYDHAMKRIEAQPKEYVYIAKYVLIWLFHARQRLSVDDIRYALAASSGNARFDPDDMVSPSIIVSACAGLVEIRRDQYFGLNFQTRADLIRDEICFIHYSVEEYFQNHPIHGLGCRHTLLAVACAEALVAHSVPDQTEIFEYNELSGFFANRPLANYAYSHWAEHARESTKHGPLHPKIHSFLSTCSTFPYSNTRTNTSFRHLAGLQLAAIHGLVSAILTGSLAYTHCSTSGYTPFHYAAAFDRMDSVHALVTAYPEMGLASDLSTDGRTPLHVAFEHYSREVVTELLSSSSPTAVSLRQQGKLDVNAIITTNDSTLLMAVSIGLVDWCDASCWDCKPWFEILSLLCGHDDIKINLQNRRGQTAFMRFMSSIISLESDEQEVEEYRPAVSTAITTFLANPNIDVNIRDQDGQSALMYSINRNPQYDPRCQAFQFLISLPQIDCNLPDNLGFTPLMKACSIGEYEIVSCLLSRDSVDVNMQDHRGMTALMHAVDCYSPASDNLKFVRDLLAHPHTDLNIMDNQGSTALTRAICRRFPIVAQLLLSHLGFDPNLQDKKGVTPLMHACGEGLVVAVNTLLFYKSVDVNLQDNQGRTGLMYAACSPKRGTGDNHPRPAGCDFNPTLPVILSHPQIDPNVRDTNGSTALTYATSRDAISILLAHPEVNPNTRRTGR